MVFQGPAAHAAANASTRSPRTSTTSGSSRSNAAAGAAGAKVTRLVFAADRMQGARQNVEAAGYEFHALLTKDDLGI